jgi:hypothetical protein
MSFWKRIFEEKNSTEEHEVLSWLSRYCTSCGLGLPSGAGTVCPQCGHDQRGPIVKKITNPHDMARAAISFGCSMSISDEYKEYVDDLIRGYGTPVDQPKKNRLLNVFLLSDLAITSIVYFTHYEDNPKHDEIVECFKEALDDYLLHAYGKDEFQDARSCLASMMTGYFEAFNEKNWLHSLSRVLQYRAESVILGVPLPGKKFALPDIHAFVEYFVHISSFLPPLRATLNRWEIE